MPGMATDQDALAFLIDRQLIHELLMTWCRALDRGDDELLNSVFHPGADAARHFLPECAGDSVTAHFAGSELISIDGNSATSELTLVAWRRTSLDSSPLDIQVGGRVLDRLERRAGRWGVTARRIVHDWRRSDPVFAEWPPQFGAAPTTLTRGSQSHDDPLYRSPRHRDRLSEGPRRVRDDDWSALQTLLDKAAIHDVTMRYCRAADRTDAGLLASVYHPDARDDHGFFVATGADMVDRVRAIRDGELADDYHMTSHLVSNQIIEVDGDWAASEVYYLLRSRMPEQDRAFGDSLVGGRYLDEFERRDGQWRIIDRILVWDFLRYDPVTAQWPRDHAQLDHDATWGSRSLDDPVYRRGSIALRAEGAGLPARAADDPHQCLRLLLDRVTIHDVLMRNRPPSPEADRWPSPRLGHSGVTNCLTANEHVAINGDRAFSECYFIGFHSTAAFAPNADLSLGGRFLDKLERVDGAWHIAARDMVLDWSRYDPA